jgi:pentatricopeptide repeat protein
MYNTIIGAALTSGRVDLGVELLNEMKQRNITWDPWTWRLMMEAAVCSHASLGSSPGHICQSYFWNLTFFPPLSFARLAADVPLFL